MSGQIGADWTGYRAPRGACEVAVIIPSYRSAGTLSRVLAGVRQQVTSRSYEVLVVHSGAEPIDPTVIESFPGFQFFHCASRQLPGMARNWGAQNVSASWLLFLDSDCVPRPDWLERMISVAESVGADALGGSVGNASWKSSVAWTMHLTEFGRWLPYARRRVEFDFPSCNALYRTATFRACGGFPAHLFPGEDTLLNHRVRRLGARLHFDPSGRVDHIHAYTLLGLLSHSHELGVSYGQACREDDLPGRRLLDLSPWLLTALIVPARSARILGRLALESPGHAVLFLALLPLAWIALGAWCVGFARSYRRNAHRPRKASPRAPDGLARDAERH